MPVRVAQGQRGARRSGVSQGRCLPPASHDALQAKYVHFSYRQDLNNTYPGIFDFETVCH